MPRTWEEVCMGKGRGRSRGGRRRGAMGRRRGERSGRDWDGQRHSVLERLVLQNMKRGLQSGLRRGLGIGQIGERTKVQDVGKRRGGMVRCKR